MDVQQRSSVLDDMSALVIEDQMADNAMTIELTNATGTYLQDLNEDCLLEIFSRNSLTPMDLCSLAETCKRFKQITQRLFSKGFAIEHKRVIKTESMFTQRGLSERQARRARRARRIIRIEEYTFSLEDHSELSCTLQNIERILKNFGAHLSELYLIGDLALENLIARYCADITLEHLKISGLESIEFVRLMQLGSIYRRLLQFSVYDCDLPMMAPSDMNCESLIELEIVHSTNGAALLGHTFPLLERFRFHFKRTTSRNSHKAINEFVKRHGCLKTVKIFGASFENCEFLLAISGCNELESLTLEYLSYNCFDISHLQNLAKLKVLNISLESDISGPLGLYDQPQFEDIDFSQAFKSLNRMEIWFDEGTYVVPNQVFDFLPQLQGLRELNLTCCYLNWVPWTRLTQLKKLYIIARTESPNGSDLLDVIRELINLEKLTFMWGYEVGYEWSLTEIEFSKIVKIVERRAHVLTLLCYYDFIYDENCNKKSKVNLIKLPYY